MRETASFKLDKEERELLDAWAAAAGMCRAKYVWTQLFGAGRPDQPALWKKLQAAEAESTELRAALADQECEYADELARREQQHQAELTQVKAGYEARIALLKNPPGLRL